MNNFEFAYPLAYVLLLLVVCIYRCPASVKKIIFPHLDLFSTRMNWINKEKLLYSLILALLVTALANPISYEQKSSNKKKGRDLVFALDTSGSMGESNFDKENPDKKKLEVLRELLKKFISQRYDDNVGVTIFGSYAYSAVPLTYDMNSISFLLDFFDVGIAGDSTAIGEGIVNALRVLDKGEAKKKVIILITDGFQNSGAISVKDAVKIAKERGVLVYTIGVGDTNSFDAKLLEKIAADTKGQAFSAQNGAMLGDVYEKIDLLEPSTIRSQHYLNKQSLYIYPLALASFLLVVMLINSRKERV
ncbi:MAG: VWA domain-containing protein [Helicobacteraceae bacterium]|nr:VWA domain-containing protein [Helicobacteraceae bacterium]